MTELEKLESRLNELNNKELEILKEIAKVHDSIYYHKIKLSEQKYPNAKGKLFWFSNETREMIKFNHSLGNDIIGNIIRPFSREEIRFDGERRFYSMNKEGTEVNHGYKYAFPVTSDEIKLYI